MIKFLKYLCKCWNEYSELEHNRYDNGFYVTGSLKLNCPYCKTDWKLNKNGVEYRCVCGDKLK